MLDGLLTARFASWCRRRIRSGKPCFRHGGGTVLLLLSLWADTGQAAGAGPSLRAFVGAPARLTWVRQVDGAGDDPFCWGDRLVIMGLDTEDGRGARMVSGEPGNVHRPMVSPDGRQIVFSRIATREAFMVDWEGGSPHRLGSGYAAAVWQDPDTAITWVYLADNGQEGWDRHNATALDRVRIDDPAVRERVWDRAPFTFDNLQLSADGTRASAQFPHPRAGYADFVTQSWTPLGRGCWTSMAPDNSYRVWIFDGPHRNITLHDPLDGSSWRVPINTAPGMDGFEIYHPRWSNHPLFLVLTGPYKQGRPGGNLITAGGPEVNVWIGRFSEDQRSVVDWLQITDDQFGNFYPDLWIDPAARDTPEVARSPATLPQEDGAAYPPGLVLLWEDAHAANEAGGRRWDAVSLGRAFWGPFGELELDGGYFRIVAEGDAAVTDDPASGAWTLEILLRPRSSAVEPAGGIAVLRDANGATWALEQAGSHLFMQVRAAEGPGSETLDLGPIAADRSTHILMTYGDGALWAWRDGKAISPLVLPADRRVIRPATLHVGRTDPDIPASGWRGRAEGIALYNRALTATEATARYQQARSRLAEHRAPPEYDIVARLNEVLPPPSPDAILPYRRALLAQVFTVESAPAESTLAEGDEIAVAHWAVLDGDVPPRAFRDGSRHRLRITPFEKRPLLEAERIFLDADHILLPVFYELAETPTP